MHSLLWLKNKNGDDAPSFWTSQKETKLEIQSRYKKIEAFADMLVSTSPLDISCHDHQFKILESSTCLNCMDLQNKIRKYQTHDHTATCAKKRKVDNNQER